jgi:RHS repeat-associated protein
MVAAKIESPTQTHRQRWRTAISHGGRVLGLLAAVVVAVLLAWTESAQADTDPTGAFETSVPIKVPPFHGLEPRLGLVYSSSAPNGWMGRGWSLTGLSTLRRQSASGGLPHWSRDDSYALDGLDLLVCPSADAGGPLWRSPSCKHRLPGQLGYTTRVESYQRIARVPATGTGVERWLVWRTDGVKATYEPGLVTGRGVLEWRLTKVEDLSGNTVTYQWGSDSGGQVGVLQTIRYADVEIRFQTEPRPDPISVATGAGLVSNGTRLQVVDLFAAGQRIRAYALRYGTNPNGTRQSLLHSVQQFGSDAVVDATGVRGPTALPATTFDAQESGTAGVWEPRVPVGVDDWAAGWPAGPDDAARFNVALSGGPQRVVPWPLARVVNGKSFPDGHEWTVLDFNGDGRTDFALVAPKGGYAEVYVELAKPGGGYQGVHAPVSWPSYSNPLRDSADSGVLVGDVNGDDLDDLVITGLGPAVTVFGHNGSIPGLGTVNPPQSGLRGDSDKLLGDVTGDGLADIVSVNRPTAPSAGACSAFVEVWAGTGTGKFNLVPWSHDRSGCWPSAQSPRSVPSAQFRLADVNGDLKADLVGFQEANTNDAKLGLHNARIFTGIADGSAGFTLSALDTGQPWAEAVNEKLDFPCGPRGSQPGDCVTTTTTQLPAIWSDVDGDARTDLTVLRVTGTRPPRGIEPDGDPVSAWTYFSQGDATYRGPVQGSTPFKNRDLRTVTKTVASGNTTLIRPSARLLSADLDGDSAADLALVSTTAKNQGRDGYDLTTRRTLSDKRGSWSADTSPGTTWHCSSGCGLAASADRPFTTVGDVNGDGQDDIMYAQSLGGAGPLAGLRADPTRRRPSTRQVLSGDVNADGRADLLYPTATTWWVTGKDGKPKLQTGVQIRVHRQRADGTYARAKPVNVDLKTPLAQKGWLVADVNCDRRADLVNIDTTFTALLATGEDQWQPALSNPLVRGGRWSVADVNGDDCDDIVRVYTSTVARFSGVYAMIGTPELSGVGNLWSQEQVPITNPVSPDVLADTLHWQTIDGDGDGKSDLVHVNGTTGAVDTLLRRSGSPSCDSTKPCWLHISTHVPTSRGTTGPGKILRPVPRCPTGPDNPIPGWPFPDPGQQTSTLDSIHSDGGDEPTWRAVDVNGDGATDLTRVSTAADGAVRVETLRSHGDGTYSARTQLGPKAVTGGALAGADGQNWIPADLDHDGRTDLARAFDGCGPPIVQGLHSAGDGRWALKTWTGPPTSGLTSSASWRIADIDGDGQASAFRTDNTGQRLSIAALDSTAPRDVMNAIDNGLGARTQIGYQPGTSMLTGEPTRYSCRLPGGASAGLVVRHLTTTEASTRTADTTSIRYTCPRYSPLLRRTVAWGETWSTHAAAVNRPASTEHVERQVHSTGIVQPVLDEVTDANGGLLSRTRSQYHPLGEQPQTNLLEHTQVSTCEAAACATSTVDLAHDEFGNITSTRERAAGSGRHRLVTTSYIHHHDRWLQALVRRTEAVDLAKPDLLLRASLTCYDGDTSANCTQLRPSPRGLPTLTRAWDDTTARYVVTGQAEYDAVGNKIRSTDARNNPTTTQFDQQLQLYPIKVCNALNHCSHKPWPWDRRADAPTLMVDANGATSSHRYDPLGRPVETRRPKADGGRCVANTTDRCAVDTLHYETGAHGTRTVATITAAPATRIWTATYTDGLGRTYLAERPSAGRSSVIVQATTTYSDASNRPWLISEPRFIDTAGPDDFPTAPSELTGPLSPRSRVTEPAGGPWFSETFTYDAQGRQIRHQHPDETDTTIQYIIRDGMTGTITRDETKRAQTHFTDGWGGLVRVEQPAAKPAIPGAVVQTDYTYNAVGDLTAITDPARNTLRNHFDSLGRKVTDDDPDRGRTQYRYDLAGNLRRTADARGRVLTYEYDQLNRVLTKTDVTTGLVSSWRYDEATGHGASVGRLTSIHDVSANGCADRTSRSLGYDIYGNITDETRCVRGNTQTFHSTFDRLDRLETLTYPDGEQLTYTYDPAGHPYSVSGYVQAMRYNARDQLTSADYSNHTTGAWTYGRRRSWLDNQTTTGSNGQPLFDNATPHNGAGIVTGTTSVSNKIAETYYYDQLWRLTEISGTWKQAVTYDDLGNIMTNSRVGRYTYGRCHGKVGHQLCAGPHAATGAGATTYEYDAAGNMILVTTPATPKPKETTYVVRETQPDKTSQTLWSIAADQLGDPNRWREIYNLNRDPRRQNAPDDPMNNPDRIYPGQHLRLPAATPKAAQVVSRRLTWNSDGQLSLLQDSKAGTISNHYDATGARVQQTTRTGTTNFYGPLADSTPSTGLTKYVYAGPLLVARHNGTQRLWYTLDSPGSPRLTTNHEGRPISRTNFAPYGETATRSGSAEPRGYTGHHTIGESDLIDMAARAYDPKLARMLAPDTIIPDLTNPQALNRYSYAYNNPVHYTDPSGHAPEGPSWHQGDDWYDFFRTSELFFEIGSAAFMPILHEQNFDNAVSSAQRKLVEATRTPVPTPVVNSSGTDLDTQDIVEAGPGAGGMDTGVIHDVVDSPPGSGISKTNAAPRQNQIPQTAAQEVSVLNFSEDDGSTITNREVQANLENVESLLRKNAFAWEQARGKAISSGFGAIPLIGTWVAAAYDEDRGKTLDAAEGIAEELVRLPPVLDIPIDTYKWHRDMTAFGNLVLEREQLRFQEYMLKRQLGHEDARWYRGNGWYYDAGGVLRHEGR